ncbi:MAG: hypothetical protein ACI9KE_005124, partial [Polyangiales bacterium]
RAVYSGSTAASHAFAQCTRPLIQLIAKHVWSESRTSLRNQPKMIARSASSTVELQPQALIPLLYA